MANLSTALMRAIGNEIIPAGESALANSATSALSNIGSKLATKAMARNIPVTASKSLAQAISVGKPEMVDIYRGISAKSDDDLVGYLRQMLDKNVKPTTYSGGSMQGEGYNFSTGRDVAEYFANRRPQQESRAVLHTRVPKDRFIGQNAQNGNRLGDFQLRAEGRGIPYENGASARQAEKDMQRYFDRNGLLGIKSPSGETYVINQNDDAWLNNLDVFSASKGRGTRIEPDDNLLSTLRGILPQKEAEPVIDYEIPSSTKKQVGKYIDGVVKAKPTFDAPATNNPGINVNTKLGRVVDKSGKPVTYYHSTPYEFDEFDDELVGQNTMADNTAFGHFTTPDKDFSKRFIDINDEGKTGRTMELQASVKNPITHPYNAGYTYPEEELDDIVKNWIRATTDSEEEANEIIDSYVDYIDDTMEDLEGSGVNRGNSKSPLYDAYMDSTFFDDYNPYEYAASDKKRLMEKGYDAVEINEGSRSKVVDGASENDYTPVTSLVPFEGKNLHKITRIPIEDLKSAEQYIPVKTGSNAPAGTGLDDLAYLMENYDKNITTKLNGGDIYDEGMVVKDILKKNGISDNTIKALEDYSTIAGKPGDYDKAKEVLRKLLSEGGEEVQKINDISRELLNTMGMEFEGDNPVAYRASTTLGDDGGLSYTIDKSIANKLMKNDDMYNSVQRYVIQPEDIVIAPQILGPLDIGADLKHIIVKKNSVDGQVYLDGMKRTSSAMGKDTKRAIDLVANSDGWGKPAENELYNKIDPKTLPKGYDKLAKLLDDPTTSNPVYRVLDKKFGTTNLLDADTDALLDYVWGGDNHEKKVFYKKIDDMVNKGARDAKALGIDAPTKEAVLRSEKWKLAQKAENKVKEDIMNVIMSENDGSDVMDALMRIGDKNIRGGYSGALDTALSERLGIAPGNTIKTRDTSGLYEKGWGGRYNRTYKDIAVRDKVGTVEDKVSTIAHERLHSFQNESNPENLGRYDKKVTDAYKQLQEDLKPFLKSREEIESIYNDNVDYYLKPVEQEARMFQTFLENNGYTHTGKAFTEWGEEINKPFAKFVNSLKKLSKAGVALPAVAGLFGIGAIAGSGKNEENA